MNTTQTSLLDYILTCFGASLIELGTVLKNSCAATWPTYLLITSMLSLSSQQLISVSPVLD